MADHDAVYGICENKCKHPVYTIDESVAKFLDKGDATNLYARKNHATSEMTYGLATENLYGHVRITDSVTASSWTNATALSALAGRGLNDRIRTLEQQMTALERRVTALEAQLNA